MNKKHIATLLLAIPLLISCSKNIPLRSDIENFIASFSLETAMQEYREVSYISRKIQFIDNVRTRTETTLDFNVKNIENGEIYYHKNVKVLDDDILRQETEINIIKENDKYFYTINNEKYEKTIDECLDIIEDFFFEETMTDYYHYNGNYYGDLVLETCRYNQDFVTIDQEKELYILSYTREGDSGVEIDGQNVNKHYYLEQNYSVNKLGMLVSNHINYNFGEEFIREEIGVTKL